MPDNVGRFRWQEAGDKPPGDLIRECGEKLTDRVLRNKFQERFQGLIFLYLMRAMRLRRIQDDTTDVLADLAQEVHVRLVQRDGQALRSSRGTTEFPVMAFLARRSSSAFQDHLRQ